MTREVKALEADTTIEAAAEFLNQQGFRHAPVFDGGKLVGIVSMRDLFRVRWRQMETQLDREIAELEAARRLLALDESGRVRALLEVNQRLERVALTDELTGLYNHRHFVQRTAQELARALRIGAPVALILADLDHFKRINDTHGHLAGNEVLQQAASVLGEAAPGGPFRASDVVARYGGEEFAVLLPDTSCDGALAAAERLRSLFESTEFMVGGTRIHLTVSLGVAGVPELGASVEDLVATADEALYRAKALGRNRVSDAREAPADELRVLAVKPTAGQCEHACADDSDESSLG